MIQFVKTTFREFPSWGSVSMVLLFGIALVGFGNGDRLLWRMTSHGAELPGVVLDVRNYRGLDDPQERYIPKVAFRDPSGTVRVMEVDDPPLRYPIQPDAVVLVAWDQGAGSLQIDVPLNRHSLTAAISLLLTSIGVAAWLCAIWLIGQRIRFTSRRMRETS